MTDLGGTTPGGPLREAKFMAVCEVHGLLLCPSGSKMARPAVAGRGRGPWYGEALLVFFSFDLGRPVLFL